MRELSKKRSRKKELMNRLNEIDKKEVKMLLEEEEIEGVIEPVSEKVEEEVTDELIRKYINFALNDGEIIERVKSMSGYPIKNFVELVAELIVSETKEELQKEVIVKRIEELLIHKYYKNLRELFPTVSFKLYSASKEIEDRDIGDFTNEIPKPVNGESTHKSLERKYNLYFVRVRDEMKSIDWLTGYLLRKE